MEHANGQRSPGSLAPQCDEANHHESICESTGEKNIDFLLIVLLVLYINHALLIQYVAQKYGKIALKYMTFFFFTET